MASRKKQSDGMAMLSMYMDEEEDDDMEDVEEKDGGQEQAREPPQDDDFSEPRGVEDAFMVDNSDRMVSADYSGNEENALQGDVNDENYTPGKGQFFRPSTPQQAQVSFTSPPQPQQQKQTRRGKLGIVDYGHDEVAMSPEPEEGEIEVNDRAMFGTGPQSANGDFHDRTPSGTIQVLTPSNQATPQLSDPSHSDKMNYAVHDSDVGGAADSMVEEQKDVDPLDKFLPPPPKAKCSEELQRKINKFLDYKKAGKSFNAEVRNRKDYRNPDFLLHAVRYQDIDQIGSCFSKDVFDPHGYDKSDYYDEIEADIRREMDRKEQERKKNQKIDFLSGGTQSGIVAAAAKINLPVPGVPPVTVSALPSADAIPRDGRQNKKSKWDKVDGDRRPLPSGVQDSLSTVGAQATILSAANAGAGYMAFAQQRRRELEERRSTDRILEKRS
ncbi:SAP30-binding protein [Parasponia andersonii]|uniref:SAP30-binding protein n=1 Tax=Parasponia andersonii TaxID=3476 RepID=A0A2P5DUS4_PARAD|nr:SAP30-binding protein [Parasponia andersonii]